MMIELIREFYVRPRSFRIGSGSDCRCVQYDNSGLCPVRDGRGERMPLFDVKVGQRQASPFSREVANERVMQLWNGGFFDPARRQAAVAALSVMDFEGRDKLLRFLENAPETDETPDGTKKTLRKGEYTL